MFLENHSYIAPIENMLTSISQKQRVNTVNVVNAQTPGYIARDVSFSDLLGSDNPFETKLSESAGGRMQEVDQWTGAPVDMQHELVEMQKNMLYYSMVTRRASSIFNALKTASAVGR